MILPSETRFADENLRKSFYALENGDSSEKELFRFINQAMDNIEKIVFAESRFQKSKSQRNI